MLPLAIGAALVLCPPSPAASPAARAPAVERVATPRNVRTTRAWVPIALVGGVIRHGVGALFHRDEPLPNATMLVRDDGWRELETRLDETATGLYLEITGTVEFERAWVEFSDGSAKELPLYSARRGGGLYELELFNPARGVSRVRVSARSVSARAWVGVRLTR